MRDVNSSDPNDSSYWPINLPAREKVRLAQRMLKHGATRNAVNKATGITYNRIGYIIDQPALWDTVDDEVAIERALGGDRSVLPYLTLYERDVVRCRLAERLEREPYEPSFQGNKPIHSSDHWLSILADQWGVNRRRIFSRLGKHNERARGRAA